MYGISWFKGKDYYQVRGWLEKRGFKKTSNCGFMNNKTMGWQEFDNGVETITIYCTMKYGQNGNIHCDKVIRYDNQVFDSVQFDFNGALNEKHVYEQINIKNSKSEMNKEELLENIMNGVQKTLNEGYYGEEFDDEEDTLIDHVDFSKSGVQLFEEIGLKDIAETYEDGYEYFFQDVALYCKYVDKNFGREFMKFYRNHIS